MDPSQRVLVDVEEPGAAIFAIAPRRKELPEGGELGIADGEAERPPEADSLGKRIEAERFVLDQGDRAALPRETLQVP